MKVGVKGSPSVNNRAKNYRMKAYSVYSQPISNPIHTVDSNIKYEVGVKGSPSLNNRQKY